MRSKDEDLLVIATFIEYSDQLKDAHTRQSHRAFLLAEYIAEGYGLELREAIDELEQTAFSS